MENLKSKNKNPTLSTRELRGDLSEAIMRAHFGKEHIIVTHHGRKYAALIPFEDLEIIESTKTSKTEAKAENDDV